MFKTVFILFLVLSLSAISYAEEDMMIKLPEPRLKGEVSLEETIEKRQ